MREARVLAVASGVDGAALVRSLGAGAAVDGRHGDLSGALQKFAPVDAVLALVGGEVTDRVVDSVKSGGVVAYPNGLEPTPKKRLGIRMIPYDAVAGVREFNNLALAIETVKLKVPIAATFPLGNASLAHNAWPKVTYSAQSCSISGDKRSSAAARQSASPAAAYIEEFQCLTPARFVSAIPPRSQLMSCMSSQARQLKFPTRETGSCLP